MNYYLLTYKLHGEKRYLIWIGREEGDSVVVDTEGLVPSFRNIESLRQFAEMQNLRLENEKPQLLQDLDWIASWLKSPSAAIDCEKTLSAWNLFSDVAASLPQRNVSFMELDGSYPLIYDKIFFGNNLPSIVPESRNYIPQWSPEEITSLAEVLAAGLDMFESAVTTWP